MPGEPSASTRHCWGASRVAARLDHGISNGKGCDTCDNCDSRVRNGRSVATVATVATIKPCGAGGPARPGARVAAARLAGLLRTLPALRVTARRAAGRLMPSLWLRELGARAVRLFRVPPWCADMSDSRREYHRAYYWAHVERRREQARAAHQRRQFRKWFPPAEAARFIARLVRLLRKYLPR